MMFPALWQEGARKKLKTDQCSMYMMNLERQMKPDYDAKTCWDIV